LLKPRKIIATEAGASAEQVIAGLTPQLVN